MSKIINITPATKPLPRIRVIEKDRDRFNVDKLSEPMAYVTIGPAETHVTIMDGDGNSQNKWTAIFGWSFLFSAPVCVGSREVHLEDVEIVALAIKGPVKIYGETVDTGVWRQNVSGILTAALDEILMGTIGTGARFSGIILAAPEWMHDLVRGSLGVRPHILKTIRKA